MKTIFSLTLIALITTFIGCATILSGTRQNVSISSMPAKAKVTVDTRYSGETPLIVELKKGENHTAVVELEGYEPASIAISKSLNGWWIAGDVLLGSYAFWLCIGVDYATGAIYKLKPENVSADLRKTIGAKFDGNTLYICVVLRPDPDWEVIGQLSAAR